MHRSIIFASAALFLAPALAFAQPFGAAAHKTSLPLLSGTYTVTIHGYCQPTLSVSKTSGAVSNVKLSSSLPSIDATYVGTIDFTQGVESGAGQTKLKAVLANGTVFLVKNSGKSGSSGLALTAATGTANDVFSQTATTLALSTSATSTSTFNIYYGATSGGVAQAAVFGGIDATGCADDAILAHK